jgi:hypothetical protein
VVVSISLAMSSFFIDLSKSTLFLLSSSHLFFSISLSSKQSSLFTEDIAFLLPSSFSALHNSKNERFGFLNNRSEDVDVEEEDDEDEEYEIADPFFLRILYDSVGGVSDRLFLVKTPNFGDSEGEKEVGVSGEEGGDDCEYDKIGVTKDEISDVCGEGNETLHPGQIKKFHTGRI